MIDYYLKGRNDAARELEAGNLSIKTMGRQASRAAVWRQILKDKYNVEISYLSGCNMSDEDENYARGFNEVSEAEINKKFGRDILRETSDEAEEIYNQAYPNVESFSMNTYRLEALVIPAGLAKCPNCNESFDIADAGIFKHGRHLPCGLEIRLIN